MCGLERRFWPARQLNATEVVWSPHVLSGSCVHQKLNQLVLSQPHVVGICDKCAEPSRVRTFSNQCRDRPRRRLCTQTNEVEAEVFFCAAARVVAAVR